MRPERKDPERKDFLKWNVEEASHITYSMDRMGIDPKKI